jgi:hypothetical protein
VPLSVDAPEAKGNNISMGAVKQFGTLSALSDEAVSLLEKAKKYRYEMDQLPADDPRRAVYEQLIRDLLNTSSSISSKVRTLVSGT